MINVSAMICNHDFQGTNDDAAGHQQHKLVKSRVVTLTITLALSLFGPLCVNEMRDLYTQSGSDICA